MGNKVKFELKNSPANLTAINAVVMDALQSSVLWSGLHPTTGGNTELDIGSSGAVGDNVWVYGNNATSGTESTAKTFGGYALIEADGAPPTNYLLEGERLKFLPVGDSITAGGGSPSIYSTSGFWVNALNSSSQEWELLDEEGVSGDRTADVLNRMAPILSSGAQVVCLLIGTNDVNAAIPNSTIASNVENIIDQMITANMKVILCQVAHRAVSQGFNDTIDQLNLLYADIASRKPNDVVLAGEFTEFNARIDSVTNESDVTGDGLHPRSFGAWLMRIPVVEAMDSKFLSTSPVYTNILLSPELTQNTGILFNGATGEVPDEWRLYYANPSVGQGGTINGDGTYTIKTGAVLSPTGAENEVLLKTKSLPVLSGEKYKFGVDLIIPDTSMSIAFRIVIIGPSFEESIFQFKFPVTGGDGESITYDGETIWLDDIAMIANGNATVNINAESDGITPFEFTISNPRFVQV